MAAAGFTAHSMQVMHRKRAAPRCPSTQTAAGVKSAFGRLLASERMSDGRVGAGRAGFVVQTLRRGCVRHGTCSRSFVRCHRARTCVHCKPRNHGRTTRQRMSRHAFGSAFTSIQNSSLSPRRRTRLLPINRCPRTPAGGREYGANGRLGQNGAWGGREAGAEASLGRKRAWGGRECGVEARLGR